MTPGPTTRSGACAQRSASALPLADDARHRRRETDAVDRVGVEQPAEEHAELVAGARALGREPPVVGEPLALEEAEDGLRVADVDREQHRAIVRAAVGPTQSYVSSSDRQRLADPLGERLGGETRLVALAAQLLDRHVARGVDLGARDDPRRPVLVPHPDVLHLGVEERVARLRHHLEVELVAEVGRVLGEDAVAEQREDRRVLPLQLELELRLELVQLVEVAHGASVAREAGRPSSSAARSSATRATAGNDRSGVELGERLEREAALVEPRVGNGRPGSSTTRPP